MTAVIALLSFAVSCSKQEPEDNTIPGLAIHANPVMAAATGQFIDVTAGGAWELSITFEGSEKWASFDTPSGNGNTRGVKFRYQENSAATSRYCTVTVKSAGGSTSIRFRQYGTSEGKPVPGSYGQKTAIQGWMELPATSVDDNYEFFTIPMKIGSVTTRNYSFYYSYTDLDAVWVAYPLNAWTIGTNIGRTDAWAYYPDIPEQYQQYVLDTYRTGLQRGHQIPSADRYGTTERNAATFYAVNMTPQDGDFNGGIWGQLEDLVRQMARSTDTLYVVTGCVLGSTKTTDRLANKITKPDAYFKALLAYGRTYGKFQNFSGVGVYLPHNPDIPGTAKMINYSMSISELEQRTGISFFPNLALQYGDDLSRNVKSQRPESWLPAKWK